MNVTVAPGTVVELRTEEDIRRFSRRRRADRSLPQPPRTDERGRVTERAPDGPQLSTPLQSPPQLAHEPVVVSRVERLVGLQLGFAMVRAVDRRF